MEAQQPTPHYAQPPLFSPDANGRKSLAAQNADMMDVEDGRTQRAASVLSGLSADDLEAAETLKSLGQGKVVVCHGLCIKLKQYRHALTTSTTSSSNACADAVILQQ